MHCSIVNNDYQQVSKYYLSLHPINHMDNQPHFSLFISNVKNANVKFSLLNYGL